MAHKHKTAQFCVCEKNGHHLAHFFPKKYSYVTGKAHIQLDIRIRRETTRACGIKVPFQWCLVRVQIRTEEVLGREWVRRLTQGR